MLAIGVMELFNTCFDIGLFIFGIMSVIQILKTQFEIYFPENLLTKIGTTMFLLLFVLVFLSNQSAVTRMVTVFLAIAGLVLGFKISLHFLEQKMLNQVHHSLKNVILQMKLGCGFRKSLELSLHYESSRFMQNWLRKLHDNVVFTQHKTPVFKSQMLIKLISELQRVDQEPNSSLKRLENLYLWLKIQSEFRRKSGKVLSQIRIQSVLITVIYFALVFFVSQFLGFHQVMRFFPVSFALMGTGVFSVFMLGRRMKWTL